MSEEYAVTKYGQSHTYYNNTAQHVLNLSIIDTIGIISSNSTVKKTIKTYGWSIIEESNLKTQGSNQYQVEYIAEVRFHHAIDPDKTVYLQTAYKF